MSRLLIHLPDGSQASFDLPAEKSVTVGREPDNTVRIDDDTVSRHHACLHPGEDGACFVQDLRSANGIAVNGQAVEGRTDLQDGDRLAFGSVVATYHVAEADMARLATGGTSVVGDVFAERYRLESTLGETDEYNNFLATDLTSEQRQVSLKIFPPGVISQAGGFEQIRREFTLVHGVPAHPHMVRLLDFGRWRGVCFLAAEWVDGYPLLDLLRRQGELPCIDALSLAREAAEVTDHARAHALPAPDLDLRATLVAFAAFVTVTEWERLLPEPLKNWPPYLLKIPPRLFAAATPSRWPLGGLVCELLGHPPSALEPGRNVRIASLGEQGNATLSTGFASAGGAFSGDVAFVDTLAKDAGVSPLMPRP